jgi:RNA polymerase primary sigma factor
MSEDIIRDWLQTAGKYKLLSKEEEQSLARRIQFAIAQGKCDRKAEDLMILHNLRLVISIAKFYASRNKGIPFEDLLQEGVCGLQIGAKRFNPDLNLKLSTYATWWIRQSIQRYLANTKTMIRIPIHRLEDYAKVAKAARTLALAGKEIDSNKLAEVMEIKSSRVREILNSVRGSNVFSLNSLVKSQSCTEWVEMMPGSASNDASNDLFPDPVPVKHAIACLPDPVAQEIVILRFGLRDQVPHTFKEISEKVGLKVEAVRLICRRSLVFLKTNHPELKELI